MRLVTILGLLAVAGCSSEKSEGWYYTEGDGGLEAEADATEDATGEAATEAEADATEDVEADASEDAPPDTADDAHEEPECSTADECPGADTDCSFRACTGGQCTVEHRPLGTVVATISECESLVCDGAGGKTTDFADDGTPVSSQVDGDCATAVCDGVGAVTSVYTESDLEDDDNVCTVDGCSPGGVVHDPIGDELCHAICVLTDAEPPLNEACGTGLLGLAPTGSYVNCGTDSVEAPGTIPGDYTYDGATWEQQVGSQTQKKYCGDVARMAAAGIEPSAGYSLGSCPPGTPCQVRFRLIEDGCTTGASRWGVCQ